MSARTEDELLIAIGNLSDEVVEQGYRTEYDNGLMDGLTFALNFTNETVDRPQGAAERSIATLLAKASDE